MHIMIVVVLKSDNRKCLKKQKFKKANENLTLTPANW